uniref:Uncharacterized protein n=1 Tax=Oryza brachyantha TaxID=4533 RepID=J3L034_ORYBR
MPPFSLAALPLPPPLCAISLPLLPLCRTFSPSLMKKLKVAHYLALAMLAHVDKDVLMVPYALKAHKYYRKRGGPIQDPSKKIPQIPHPAERFNDKTI